jgi:hypothetical protein
MSYSDVLFGVIFVEGIVDRLVPQEVHQRDIFVAGRAHPRTAGDVLSLVDFLEAVVGH